MHLADVDWLTSLRLLLTTAARHTYGLRCLEEATKCDQWFCWWFFPEVIPSLRTGYWKSSATNSRQSALCLLPTPQQLCVLGALNTLPGLIWRWTLQLGYHPRLILYWCITCNQRCCKSSLCLCCSGLQQATCWHCMECINVFSTTSSVDMTNSWLRISIGQLTSFSWSVVVICWVRASLTTLVLERCFISWNDSLITVISNVMTIAVMTVILCISLIYAKYSGTVSV